MKLQGKSVVVTGASSGMGKAIVELFVKEGANVVAVARRQERLEALVEKAGGFVHKKLFVLAEGDSKNRADVNYLATIPLL